MKNIRHFIGSSSHNNVFLKMCLDIENNIKLRILPRIQQNALNSIKISVVNRIDPALWGNINYKIIPYTKFVIELSIKSQSTT